MGIESTRTSESDNAPRQVDEPRDRPQDKPRDAPKAEQVDRFRNLLQAKSGADRFEKLELRKGSVNGDAAKAEMTGASAADRGDTQTDIAVLRKSGDQGDQSGESQKHEMEVLKPAELAALNQAHLAVRGDVPIAPPASAQVAHANPQKLADMLERHVRQMAVSSDVNHQDNGQVLLRLNDATLPGTDLLLSRTETGWLLRADVRSRGSFEALQQAAPKLTERFASRSLGVLEVDPQFHG